MDFPSKQRNGTVNGRSRLDRFKLAFIRRALRELKQAAPYIRDCFIATRAEVPFSTVYRVKTGRSYSSDDTRALEGTEEVRRMVQRLVGDFLAKAHRVFARGTRWIQTWRERLRLGLFSAAFRRPRQEKLRELSPGEKWLQDVLHHQARLGELHREAEENETYDLLAMFASLRTETT